MSTKRKFNNFFSVHNINNVQKNKFYRKYRLGCIKLTIKNKEKIKFYIKKQEEKLEKEFLEKKKILDELKEFRKNKNYILTVYITTYNHAKTIERAIESVLNQDTHYEYLIKILDDCSKDKTGEICLEYAKRYPEKIEYVPMPRNTKLKHLSSFYKTIKTKYFAILDGDDYWLGNDKIEKAVDFLEVNQNYTIWASDTLFKNFLTNNRYSYVHGHLGFSKNINNTISFDNYIYLHLSSRIHRNVIDWNKEFVKNRKRDIFIYYAHLDKGPCYFHDEIMSVYNFTGKGVFSKLGNIESRYSTKYSFYAINKYLNYRHDRFFSKMAGTKNLKFLKLIFGKRIGWSLWIFLLRYSYMCELCKNKYAVFKTIENGHGYFSKTECAYLDKISRYQV